MHSTGRPIWARCGPLADPMARLKRLILDVYGADDDRVILRFYLRGISGSDVPSKLEEYLKEVDPSTAIKRMIFASPDKLKKAFDLIRAPHFEIPDDSGEDEELIARILWKLAFDKERVESRLAEFYERLDDFQKTVRAANIEKEDGRSLVRSVGVNLFVSVEDILDLTLSFLTWLFLSDPISDALKFNLQRGRGLAASLLNGAIEIGGDPLQLDDSGRNTLFPLIVGLTALARRVREVVQDPTSQEKPAVLLAHYAASSTLQLYPYRHYSFACDISFTELSAALTLISEVSSALQSEPVLQVRNRLDHKSENFPSREEMLRCADVLRTQIGSLEDAGFIPIVYVTKSVTFDRFNRELVTSVDYSGREYSWFASPSMHAIRMLPDLREPQLLVKSISMPHTAEPARFRMQEISEFTEMWKDYPKRSAPTEFDRLLATHSAENS